MCGGPALRDRPEVEGDGLPGGQGGLAGGPRGGIKSPRGGVRGTAQTAPVVRDDLYVSLGWAFIEIDGDRFKERFDKKNTSHSSSRRTQDRAFRKDRKRSLRKTMRLHRRAETGRRMALMFPLTD